MLLVMLTVLATALTSAFLLVALESKFLFFKSEIVKALYCFGAAVLALAFGTVVAVWQGVS